MIFETSKKLLRKYEVTSIINKLRNPTITSLVVYSDKDQRSVEKMTKSFLQKKSPFTVFFIREG